MNENASDIRRGQVIKLDSGYWLVQDATLNTPGNKRGIVQMKLKSVSGGQIVQKRFSSTEMVEFVHTEKRPSEFLYQESAGYVFMDNETYEQLTLNADLIQDQLPFLIPNSQVSVMFVDEAAMGIDMPASVELTITECEAGIKGDTANNPTKKATLETGHEIKVPLFIKADERVKVDTRTGEFQGRA